MTNALRIEGETGEILRLDDVFNLGRGVEVLSGVVGMGLPPVSVQFDLGAGDGATYRGKRVQSRDIDLPLYVLGKDRAALKFWTKKLSLILAGKTRLVFEDDEDGGDEWYIDCYRVGGGEWVYGVDTIGDRDMRTVVTLRAPDPYWTLSEPTEHVITNEQDGRGLLGPGASLAELQLMDSQAIGSMDFSNKGDADAYPVWTVEGPANSFRAVSPVTGEEFEWVGTLALGETLTIDTKTGTVIDGTLANRYDGMQTAPRMWTIPPGESTGDVELTGATVDSKVTCTFRPRKWAVI